MKSLLCDGNQLWNDIWKDQLKELDTGHFVEKKENDKDFIELIGHKFTLDNPRDRLISDKNRCIDIFRCIGQFLWITQGSYRLDDIAYYKEDARKYSSDDVIMKSAYGSRLFGIGHLCQIQHILRILKSDSTKRKAVASIYLPQFDQHEEIDEVPCTLGIQYLVRDNKVNAITYMRSQNAYSVLPYDLFIFTMLQEYITTCLGSKYELGTYTHFSGSFHMLKKDKTFVQTVLQNETENIESMNSMPYEPKPEEQLKEMNKFEICLRNAVQTHTKSKTDLTLELHYKFLEETFEEEYWKQIGKILLCYAAHNMGYTNTLNEFKNELDSLYQYYIDLALINRQRT